MTTKTSTATAQDFFADFFAYYKALMVEAAPKGDEACLAAMNTARDLLQQIQGCSKREASNTIRGIHCIFCDRIGHEIPTEYRQKVIRTMQAHEAGLLG